MRFQQDSYTGEEGTPVTNIRLLATDFAEPFRVQIFVFTLDADVPEKEVEAELSELVLNCRAITQFFKGPREYYFGLLGGLDVNIVNIQC